MMTNRGTARKSYVYNLDRTEREPSSVLGRAIQAAGGMQNAIQRLQRANEVLGHKGLSLKNLFLVCQKFTGPARHGILRFLKAKGRQVRLLSSGGRVRSTTDYSFRLRRQINHASIDVSEDSTLYLVDGIPVLVRQEGWGADDKGVRIYFPRGLFSLEYFPQAALDHAPHLGNSESRFDVYHVGSSWGEQKGHQPQGLDALASEGAISSGAYRMFERGASQEDLEAPDPCEHVEQLALTPSAETAVRFVRTWFRAREDYERRRMIWRCALLFEGAPGTGKTALARALAYEMGVAIHVFHLASLSSEAFESAWEAVTQRTPCVVLLDDFDRVYHGDKLVTDKGPAFNLILQALSGVAEVSGLMVVVAVNDMSKVHPTIYDGHSEFGRRITVKANFENPHPEQREAIARRILFDFPAEKIAEVVAAGKADSGKQFVDRCARAVLDRLHQTTGVEGSMDSVRRASPEDMKVLEDALCAPRREDDPNDALPPKDPWRMKKQRRPF